MDLSKVLKMLVKNSNCLLCKYYILILVGIPIDMICGTSIGSLMGALYCKRSDPDEIFKIAEDFFKPKEFYKKIFFAWKLIKGITFPVIAQTDGKCYNYI